MYRIIPSVYVNMLTQFYKVLNFKDMYTMYINININYIQYRHCVSKY